jgi:hypothetical protein
VTTAAVQRLRAELVSDLGAARAQVEELRGLSLDTGDPGQAARAAVALHHLYSALESGIARVCGFLGEEVPRGDRWHIDLLQGAALVIEGVRPALVSPAALATLRELLGFRHFFRHGYSARLDSARLDVLKQGVLAGWATIESDFAATDRWLADVVAQGAASSEG